jgi:hypothetical protein
MEGLQFMKVKKSSNFDRNMDFNKMEKEIQTNLYASSEILKQASNKIAPLDKGTLRQNVKTVNSGLKSTVTWEQPYAGERYTNNKKNPQTTRWIEKGASAKKKELDNRMNKGVLK